MLIRALAVISFLAAGPVLADPSDVQLTSFEGNYVRISGTGFVRGCSEKLELRVVDGKKLSFRRDGQEMFSIEPGTSDGTSDWEGLWANTRWHHELSGSTLTTHQESWVGCVAPYLFCRQHYESWMTYTLNNDGSLTATAKNTDAPEIEFTCQYQRTN